MKDEFFKKWEKRNRTPDLEESQHLEGEMASLLRQYTRENFPHMEDDSAKVAALKRDFESDLLHIVVADALGVDVDLCKRFRWKGDRGVIDTEVGERKSIPPSIREEILERDNGECVRCGHEVKDNLTLHHIIPRSHGGVDAKANYAMICGKDGNNCHIQAHAGNFGTKRIAYETREEFWEKFCNE